MRLMTRHAICCPECGAAVLSPEILALQLGFVEMLVWSKLRNSSPKHHTAESLQLSPNTLAVYVCKIRCALKETGSQWEIISVGKGRGRFAQYYAKLTETVRDQNPQYQEDVPDGRRVNPIRS